MIRFRNLFNASRSPARNARQGAGLESPPTTVTAGPVIESAGPSREVPCREFLIFPWPATEARAKSAPGREAPSTEGMDGRAGRTVRIEGPAPAPPSRRITALDVQLAEAHNLDLDLSLTAEGLRLSQLSNPSRARGYAVAADVRFQTGEWRP